MPLLLKYQIYAAVWVFVMLLLFTYIVAWYIYSVEKDREIELVQNESEHVKHRIEAALSQSNNATRMIAIMIEHDLLKDHFKKLQKNC